MTQAERVEKLRDLMQDLVKKRNEAQEKNETGESET